MVRNWTLTTENEVLVYAILQKIGINLRLKSAKYIYKAMLIHIDKPNLPLTTVVYPMLAKEFNVDPRTLNTRIGHIVKQSWETISQEVVRELTDQPLFTEQGKIPTNKEFFFMARQWVLKNKKK